MPLGSGVASPFGGRERISAVLFDLDGTLYRQAPLRQRMALELLTLPFSNPFKALARLRALRAFRHAQEELRQRPRPGVAIADAQLQIAAEASGLRVDDVLALTNEWMQRRPLKHLRACRADGVDELLAWLATAGVRTGVLSDYPAEAKLEAMGLSAVLSPVLCTTDPDIAALKPSPRGFLRACAVWHLDPGQVLFVGDRIDVDAAGAAAAGMPCVIVGPAGTVPSLSALLDLFQTASVLRGDAHLP